MSVKQRKTSSNHKKASVSRATPKKPQRTKSHHTANQKTEAAVIQAPSTALTDEQIEQAFEEKQPVAMPQVQWQASEYIHHQKSPTWYFVLGVIVVVLALVFFYFLTDWLLVLLILLMGASVGIYASREPRTLTYSLDYEGLLVGDKDYLLDEFRSFSVNQEGEVVSIDLTPLQRFRPVVTLYVSIEDAESIVAILGDVLPHEDHLPDIVDQFLKKIRF